MGKIYLPKWRKRQIATKHGFCESSDAYERVINVISEAYMEGRVAIDYEKDTDDVRYKKIKTSEQLTSEREEIFRKYHEEQRK